MQLQLEAVYENIRVIGGWWERLLDERGETLETSLDKIRMGTRPKTVVCAECSRRHPNPRVAR